MNGRMTEHKKVLLDTDIGTDIDDAVALAYLLRQPQCELVGITTVSGEPQARAMLASCLCRAAGRADIPIYPGSRGPFIGTQLQPLAQQAEVLSRFDHQTVFPEAQHIGFMIDTIRRHPGEISLLAVGPMTNIALLFAADPEIPGLLKELVLMCGVFGNGIAGLPRAEWNARVDPVAAAMVYAARPARHRSVGLDVTCQVKMPAAEVRERFRQDILQIVLAMAEVWFQKRDLITFHDPLAAVSLFDEGICRFETGTADVELYSRRAAGATYWTRGDDGPHQAAFHVDRDAFFQRYFEVFAGGEGASCRR